MAQPTITPPAHQVPNTPLPQHPLPNTTTNVTTAQIATKVLSTPLSISNFFSPIFASFSKEQEEIAKIHQQTAAKRMQALLKTSDTAVQTSLTQHNKIYDEQQNILNELNGTPFFNRTLESITQKIITSIEYAKPELLKSFPKLNSTIHKLLTNICVTIAKQIPEKERTHPKNLIHDIFVFVINLIAQHVEGDSDKGIPPLYDQLLLCEKIKDEKLRNQKISEVFTPLSNSLLALAMPNGIEDFGYNKYASKAVNVLGFIGSKMGLKTPLGSILEQLLGSNLGIKEFLQDPGFIGKLLYPLVIDPILKIDQQEKILSKTDGGRAILHIAKLGQEQLAPLLLNLLGEKSTELAPQMISPILTPEQIQKYKKESPEKLIKDNSQKATEDWFARKFKDTVTSLHPSIIKAGAFGGFVIKAVVTKLLVHLAEGHAKKKIHEIENPYFHAEKRLLEVLYNHYNSSTIIQQLFNGKLKKDYEQFRIHSLRLWKLKGTKPHEEPNLENERQHEIRVLNSWIETFLKSPDRRHLINTFFKPLTEELLRTCGLDKTDGLRLNFGELNATIQDSIPDGLCCLYELLVVYYPGLVSWLHPENVIKDKSEQLYKATGTFLFSSIANTIPGYILKIIPFFLNKHSSFLSAEMINAIDFSLPNNLKMKNLNTLHRNEVVKAFQFITAIKEGDTLWNYFSAHLEEIILDIFIANSHNKKYDPISFLVFQLVETIAQFQHEHKAVFNKAYSLLPLKPSLDEKEKLYKEFEIIFKNFTHKLLKIIGIDTHLSEVGKIGVFSLDKKLEEILPKTVFRIHLKLTRLEGVEANIFDQLCAAFYDKSHFSQKLKGINPDNNLTSYLEEMANPIGKSSKDRMILWKQSETDQLASYANNITNFASELICWFIRDYTQNESGSIVESLTSSNGFLSNQNLDQNDKDVLHIMINSLSNINAESFNNFWTYAARLINIALSQITTNAVASVPMYMPNEKTHHIKWVAIGDIAVSIFKIIGDNLQKIEGLYNQSIGTQAINIRLQITKLKSGVNSPATKNEITALYLKLKNLFNPMTKDLMSFMERKASLFDRQHPTQGIPIPEDWKKMIWEQLIPDALSGLFANFFESVSPSVEGLRDRLHKIFNSNHVAESIRILAKFIKEITPYKLREQKDLLSKDLLNSIELILEKQFSTGYGFLILKMMRDNRETIQQMIANTFHLLGSNTDDNGTMNEYVWPFLEKYSEVFLLIACTKLFERIKMIEDHAPEFLFEITTELLGVVTAYLTEINEVTKKTGVSSLYRLTQKEVFTQLKSLHKALQKGLNASPEDAHKARLDDFYNIIFERLLQIANITSKEIPAPIYLQGPLFNLLKSIVGPLALSQMTTLCYKEDGKEPMLDKTALIIFENLTSSLEAFKTFTKKIPPPEKELTAKEKVIYELLLKYCKEFYKQSVQLIPEYYTKQLLSLNPFAELTAPLFANIIKEFCHEWSLISIINACAQFGLPKFCDGDWKGINKDKYHQKGDFNVERTPKQIEDEPIEDDLREQKVKSSLQSYASTSIIGMAKNAINWLWDIIENAIKSLCEKIFGTSAASVYNPIITALRHIGTFISWLLIPVYYIVKGLIYIYGKIQTGRTLKNIKHPANIELGFRLLEAATICCLKFVKAFEIRFKSNHNLRQLAASMTKA